MRILKLSTLFLLVVIMVFGLALPASAKAPPSTQTYTVMVGLEKPNQGIGVNAYFPDTVTIHVGDTVHWVQNSNEIHTVTFLAGTTPVDFIVPAPVPVPSPLVLNPVAADPTTPADGQYDGATYSNSGLMGREAGEAQEFDLTFTTAGEYDYLCLVHGAIMSGKVVVVDNDTAIPSPNQAMAQGRQQMASMLASVPEVARAAKEQVQPPVANADGTTTYHVMIGYAEGQIDLMQFFPNKLTVRPGDTVVWEMSPFNDAPHTVTFLNGAPAPGLIIPVPQPSGPPLLYLNPATLFEYPPAPATLTRSGVYNSGVMNPIPGTTYTLVIGDMAAGVDRWVCLLHDESGMTGTLMVVPNK